MLINSVLSVHDQGIKVDHKEITEMIKIADKEGTGVVKFDEVGVCDLWLLALVRVQWPKLSACCSTSSAFLLLLPPLQWYPVPSIRPRLDFCCKGIDKMGTCVQTWLCAEVARGCSCEALPRNGYSKRKANSIRCKMF